MVYKQTLSRPVVFFLGLAGYWTQDFLVWPYETVLILIYRAVVEECDNVGQTLIGAVQRALQHNQKERYVKNLHFVTSI